TQLACDAALFPIRVATQRVKTAEPGRGRRFLMRVTQRDLTLEEILAGQAHALEHFGQHQAAEEIFDSFHNWLPIPYCQMFQGVCIQIARTTSQIPVSGMKIFQPKRMIWS